MIALKYLKKGGGAYADGHPRQSRDRADKKQIKTEGCFMNRFSDCRATMGRFRAVGEKQKTYKESEPSPAA